MKLLLLIGGWWVPGRCFCRRPRPTPALPGGLCDLRSSSKDPRTRAAAWDVAPRAARAAERSARAGGRREACCTARSGPTHGSTRGWAAAHLVRGALARTVVPGGGGGNGAQTRDHMAARKSWDTWGWSVAPGRLRNATRAWAVRFDWCRGAWVAGRGACVKR